MLALEDIGGQEAEDRFAGAIEDDAALHHLRGDLGGEFGRVELDAEHQAHAADVDDGVVACGELGELGVEEVTDVADVVEEVLLLDGIDDGDGDGAGEWTSAEGGAVHAGGEGEGQRRWCRASRPWGSRWRWGLARGGDVGQDAVVLVGEPLSSASEAALDLVG